METWMELRDLALDSASRTGWTGVPHPKAEDQVTDGRICICYSPGEERWGMSL